MELTENDLTTIVQSAILYKGHAGHHIESLNYFIRDGIKQIVTKFYKWDRRIDNKRSITAEDKEIESYHYEVTYPEVYIRTTKVFVNKTDVDLTPQNARNTDKTYGVTLLADIKVTISPNSRSGQKIEPKTFFLKEQKLSVIPIGVKTDMCVLKNYSREALLENGEDPKDPGGYAIVGGKEWVINCLENTWFNAMSIYKNTKFQDELVRGTIIAKDGDAFENTYQNKFFLRENYKIDYQLTIGRGTEIRIPFFTLFRIFGISSDKQITEFIMGNEIDSESHLAIIIRSIVEAAFKTNYGNTYNRLKSIVSPEKNALQIALMLYPEIDVKKLEESPEEQKHYVAKIFEHFDDKVLQQYGTSMNDRHMKAFITGKYIRDIILAYKDIVPTSDRDSFQVKRIHAAGITLSKAFKQQFNKMIHLRVRSVIEQTLENESFYNADFEAILKNHIGRDGAKLETALSSSISRGDEKFTVRGQEVINRVSSQLLQHKNDFNVISALNVVTAAGSGSKAAKATERADLMRRLHSSSIGYICPNYSADTGEAVGINKLLASTAQITLSSSSALLEDYIKKNKDIKLIPLTEVPSTEVSKYCFVAINGKYIGFCENQMEFARKYRQLRRNNKIDKYVSIVAEQTVPEVIFWTDYGRLTRPMIIVYNNIEEIYAAVDENRNIGEANNEKKKEIPAFKQWIKLTKKHIDDLQRGIIGLEYLIDHGIMEYISASEQFNCFHASFDSFAANKNNILLQYTHMDINQATLGIISLASPMANHSSAVRITMSTNHVKQACNRYNAAWPARFDNNSYFAYRVETPLISTIANNFMYSSGQNLMIAVAMHGGRNQEDSGDINKGSIELGIFNGIYLKVENIVLPDGVLFGSPEESKTTDIKPKAKYDQLDERGFIKKGSIVTTNTVLASMYARLDKPQEQYIYTDRSHIYTGEEKYRVHNVIVDKNPEKNTRFCRILMYAIRHINVGAKTSSRMGNKSIISNITRSSDMPYTIGGMQPDLILNPHSFPSRMAISQCIEGTLGTYAAHFGCYIDATTFKKLDIDTVIKRLAEVPNYGPDGLDIGYHYMYNGKTGKMMPVKIFFVPNTYQRLGKFVENAQYAVNTGPKFAATQQPLQGKKHNGGLRLGEMEQATLVAHGSMRFMDEKFRGDSDGCDMYVCGRCEYRVTANEQNSMYVCKCGPMADVRRVPSCFTSNQLLHSFDAINLDVKFKLSN